MIEKVKRAIVNLDGINTVAVAVSGGADSVALLDVMVKLREHYAVEVLAAHFNHRLRGKESDHDEKFVRKLCDKLGVRLICGSADVRKYSREQKISTELAARQLRYDFFEKLPADAVATAHTASDNLETVIFNLTRGTAIGGLCGIPVKRDKYIRPLIFCTRDEIENYCLENGLQFVTDSSNLKDDYIRNRIRHNIIPLLKEINPAVENNVLNTSVSLSLDRDMLDSVAKQEYEKMITDAGLDVSNLADIGGAISRRILRMFCKDKTKIEPDYRHTDDLLSVALNGGRCSLQGGFSACRQKNVLKIASLSDKPVFNVKITKLTKVNNLFSKNAIDCDKIVGELKVRTREPGDKIKLFVRKCTKTLKCIYNENSIPPEIRSVLPVISDDLGVVWVCGIGPSERVAVDKNSKLIYKISYEIISGGNNTK